VPFIAAPNDNKATMTVSRRLLRLRRLATATLSLLVAATMSVALRAERLPIKAYTTADGLAHNVVNRIVRDSRGFMWFATNDGLSRFDGYGFTNYTVEQGLPHRRVMDFLEAANGEFWLATYGGLVRFTPAAVASPGTALANDVKAQPPMFSVVLPDGSDPDARIVTALRQTRDGTIWCGTRRGLFRLERVAAGFFLRAVDLGMPTEHSLSGYVTYLLEDRSGSLWIATVSGLYRQRPDGSVARYDPQLHVFGTHVHHLFEDRDGRLWVATRYTGLLILDISGGGDPVILERYDAPKDLPSNWVYETRHTSDGRIWLSTNYGLAELIREPPSGGIRLRMYDRRHGLTHHAPNTMAEDGAGNLWLGTESAGAMCLARNGFTTWSMEDGVVSGVEFLEDRKGDLYTIAFVPGANALPTLRFGRVAEPGFEWFVPPVPFYFGWGVGAIQTERGEWWMAGSEVVLRYASVPGLIETRTAKPTQVYGTKDGLQYGQAMHLIEDARGGIWVALWGPMWGLSRWDPTRDEWRNMVGTPGLPTWQGEAPRAFAKDAAGHIWIGFNTGAARFRDQRFDFYGSGTTFPTGRIVSIHAGQNGCLWLGSSEGGLIRVDDAASAQPRFRTFTTAQGLSSNVVEAIALDRDGLVYAATSRGIDQFNPATGHVRNLSVENDLRTGAVTHAYRDRKGSLWFATNSGIAKYTPEPYSRSTAPSIYVIGLRVAGQPRHISALGETEVAVTGLGPSANQLEIQFVAIGSGPSSTLRYQYRLEGADRNWSSLTTQRSVTYASLAPGTYRFLVRAMTTDGVVSATPAMVSFTVLPPFWRTWWFLSIVILVAAATAYTLHRQRIARIVELGRVRARIATDLHDDLGANLTRIAILSEVAKKRMAVDSGDGEEKLSAIATIARESVSSMDDIVWAISPDRDALQEVVGRMRHCAEEAFDGREIAVTFDAPETSQTTPLGIDVRRDVYLIFKEAVNNAARHAGCTRIRILFRVSAQQLLLEIADDGAGFDVMAHSDGTGLASMRRRAVRLGATLDIASSPDRGTRLALTMPAPSARAATEPTSRRK
jgi:ligand-binding sensor domain-containing protein/signal transduction histidine kinase